MKGCVATTDIGTPADLPQSIVAACTAASPLTNLLLQVAEA
jgi:hypothetical protein